MTEQIPITMISVPTHRLRALQPEKVRVIAESMSSAIGLLHPIVVRRCGPNGSGSYELVVGLHRLEAAKTLGRETIAATVRDGIDNDQAELAEIDENLCRAELSPAERALHIGCRKRLYERLHPETKHGATGKGRAKSRQVGDSNERFTKETAGKTGQSERTIQRDARRAESVAVLPDIVGTSLDNGAEIDALAKLPADEQRALAERARHGEQVTAKVEELTTGDVSAEVSAAARRAPYAAEKQQLDGVCPSADFSEPNTAAATAMLPANSPSARKTERRTVLKIREDSDLVERQLIRDGVLDEYFASATGDDILLRIPTDGCREVCGAWRRLRDALAPHAFDGTEAHHAINGALPGIENELVAAALKKFLVVKYRDTISVDAAIEVMLRLLETGEL